MKFPKGFAIALVCILLSQGCFGAHRTGEFLLNDQSWDNTFEGYNAIEPGVAYTEKELDFTLFFVTFPIAPFAFFVGMANGTVDRFDDREEEKKEQEELKEYKLPRPSHHHHHHH